MTRIVVDRLPAAVIEPPDEEVRWIRAKSPTVVVDALVVGYLEPTSGGRTCAAPRDIDELVDAEVSG
jgi:hypothetical protein